MLPLTSTRHRASRLMLALAASLMLPGCAVLSVAGAVAGTAITVGGAAASAAISVGAATTSAAISVTGAAVSTGIHLTGKLAEKKMDGVDVASETVLE